MTGGCQTTTGRMVCRVGVVVVVVRLPFGLGRAAEAFRAFLTSDRANFVHVESELSLKTSIIATTGCELKSIP